MVCIVGAAILIWDPWGAVHPQGARLQFTLGLLFIAHMGAAILI